MVDSGSERYRLFLRKKKIAGKKDEVSPIIDLGLGDLPASILGFFGRKNIHSLRVGLRNLFPVVLLCQFLVLAGNRFWFYILTYFITEPEKVGIKLECHLVVLYC